MGNPIAADVLLAETAEQTTIPPEKILELFSGTPLDFPVTFTEGLPFGAHRFGMVGITLCGKVRLLKRVLDYHPVELLALLRHEAEHVRQQRKSPILFYPRYGLSWLISYLNPWPGELLKALRDTYGRSQGAYRAIPYEVEAYGVGDAMRASLSMLV